MDPNDPLRDCESVPAVWVCSFGICRGRRLHSGTDRRKAAALPGPLPAIGQGPGMRPPFPARSGSLMHVSRLVLISQFCRRRPDLVARATGTRRGVRGGPRGQFHWLGNGRL